MGTDDHILISLSGEGPWGFRLQGGSEKSLPLLVSKVRKRSKACRGGLRENDELVSINGKVCAGLSHAEAMLMIDSSGSNLYLRVKRAGAGAQTVPRPHRSQDPPSSWAVSSSSKSTPGQPKLLHLESITSPPDSEAYYGETDSDADFQTSPGHPQSTQQHHSQQQLPPEKHRRARKKSPRSPPGTNMKTETEQQSLSEMSGYESGPGCVSECAVVPTGGVAKREITYQPGGSRAETPFSDVEGFLPAEEEQQLSSVSAPSPESLLLPHATKTIRAERHLIPMIGPVDHPVDEDLTTSYSEKAKEAKLHRSESVQEKNVKEARTKCRTIASLLTDAPNPHSKGVLMFKKRRQRAKKYTLVSYGSVDEDRYNEDEDGVFPTSESEFDEEGFSDARSLTNHSDWDSTYLDIEKPKMEHEHQEEKGLSEASGKGAEMFEMQRQRSEQFSVDAIPPQNPQEHQTARPVPPQRRTASARSSVNVERSQDTGSSESTKVACTNISLSTSQPTQGSNVEASAAADGIFNRSARPFTPGQVGQRTVASSVTFNPSTQKRVSECVQNLTPSPFTQFSPTALVNTQKASGSSVASLYIPAPGKPTVSSTTQHSEGTRASEIPSVAITPRTTTASIYLSSPLRPSGPQTESSQPAASKITDPTPVTPLAHPASHVVSPASSVLKEAPSFTTPVTSLNLSPESVTSREQRISVPVGRTGILNEARKRGGKKQMFAKVEEKKCLPNPELLSMVQNLDEKPKQDQPGTGFESGPEEDFLSLGAEACNFMQSSARKLKVPPPVAPKPSLKATPEQLVNGNQDMPQLKGKGAELFAKRQSRMDKFVVDSTRSSSSRPNSRPRTPSPTPSLPSAWKYSSNIRAPPPIAYNPIHSPFYPLAASKSQPSKVESKVKKSPAGKARMQAIDFMRHQPYQLNSAMFCFGDSSNTTNQNPPSQETGKSHLLITPARQAPVKTARTHDIKRFSTPTPMSSSVNMAPTVLTPRSATTLAEPVWRTDATCQSMPVPSAVTPTPYQTPPQGVLQNFDTVENRAATVLSPTSSITSPRSSISRIQVPKPRFSASKIGIQANVWRPAKVTF